MSRRKELEKRIEALEEQMPRRRNASPEQQAQDRGYHDALKWKPSRPKRSPSYAFFVPPEWEQLQYTKPDFFDPVWAAYEFGYEQGVKERDALEDRRAAVRYGITKGDAS